LRKKKILLLLLSLVVIYSFWLGFQIVRFKTYNSPALEKTPLEIQGSYHIHTIYSDGRKTPEKIAGLASRSALDFVILTDHGDPNLASVAAAGWKNNVLVLAGSELSVNRGHLVALGFTLPSAPFSQNAEQAANQIKSHGGLSIIAHPYSKVSWSWGKSIGYTGIEIINANTLLKYDLLRSIPYLPSLLVKPDYTLLKMLRRPVKNLKKWDELNHTHPTFGFYSVDAHLLYRSLLPFLQLHVLLQNPLSKDFEQASHQVLSALHHGRFYNAVEYAAQAHGFRFWAKNGQKIIQMGETTVFDQQTTLHVRLEFPFVFKAHLIHNGKEIMASTEKNIIHQITQPGFYRVEVYLKEQTPLRNDIPWILSNPIFFREKGS
jgi:hypothetical protein